MLNFIFDIKKKELSKNPQYKVMPAFQRIYIDFFYFKWFCDNEVPIIFTEGKTDIIYLKTALKQLKKKYPEKISDKLLEIQFIYINSYLQNVFGIASGTSGLQKIINQYGERTKSFFKNKLRKPVFFLFDFDDGAKEIKKILTSDQYDKKNNKLSNLCNSYRDNIYILFTHLENEGAIENYFDPSVLKTEINGKTFSVDNEMKETEKYYGKNIFAEKVVKKNAENISFDKFIPLFDEISNKIN